MELLSLILETEKIIKDQKINEEMYEDNEREDSKG